MNNILRNIREYSLYLLLFLLPFCNRVLPGVNISISGDMILLVFFIVAGFHTLFSKEDRKLFMVFLKESFKTPFMLCLFSVALMMLISIGYSGKFKVMALKEALRFGTYIVLILLWSYEVFKKDCRSKFIKLILLVGLTQSILGVIQFFTGFMMLPEFSAATSNYTYNKIHGTFSNPNTFAAFLVVIFFPIATECYSRVMKNKEWYFSIIPILLLMNIIVTRSRNGVLGLAIGALFLGIIFHKKIFYGLIAAGGAGAVLLFSNRKIIDMAQDDFRISIWKYAFKMIKDNPIKGIGNGTFREMYNVYRSKYPQISVRATLNMPTHNSYLKVWSELGIFTLALFLGAIFFCGKSVIELVKKATCEEDRRFFMGIACSIFAFIFMNLNDDLFFIPKLTTFFWVFAGIVLGNKLRRIKYVRRN